MNMVQTRGKSSKSPLICISSSSSSSSEDEYDDDGDNQHLEQDQDDDDGDYSNSDPDTNSGSSDSCQVEDGESESEDEFSAGEDVDKESSVADDEHNGNKVISLLREGDDLQTINLSECKAYLRRHRLRLSGTKTECIQRIKEHWRIKDGRGEALYPRSSFSINWDVCKGDVVLFTQKVYKKFDKMTRSGSLLGKRTIAGRIVKESYGAAKQQHTFTVEVLWSKGTKKLPSLAPLLVKGRNLYRLKTFRQRWKNEGERSKVLAEKHKRGAAARQKRAMKKTSDTNRGTKRQKLSHDGSFHRKHASRTDKRKQAKRQHEAPVRNVNSNQYRRKINQLEQFNSTHPSRSNPHPSQYFHHSHMGYHQQNVPSFPHPYNGVCSLSATNFQHSRPSPGSYALNHGAYARPHYNHLSYEHHVPKNFNPSHRFTNTYTMPAPNLHSTQLYRDREYRF